MNKHSVYVQLSSYCSPLLVREENVGYVVLAEFLSAGGAFAMPVAQVLVDALLAEEMKAPGDGDALKAILAHGAAQHAERHFQHVGVLGAQRAASSPVGAARRPTALLLSGLVLGLALSLQSI
jgi:hypothetical protein